jgi:hypothetical protein
MLFFRILNPLYFLVLLLVTRQAAGLGDMNPPLFMITQDPMKGVLTRCRQQNDSATSTRQPALLVLAPYEMALASQPAYLVRCSRV